MLLEKLREVFTDEYRQETKYREYLKQMLQHLKLTNKSEPIDVTMERLMQNGFESNFSIKVGRF